MNILEDIKIQLELKELLRITNRNYITSYQPNSINELLNLEQLYLDYVNLSIVPDSIGLFTKLRKLNLNGNNLVSLPNTISNLKKLEKLYLIGNKIQNREKEEIQLLLSNCKIFFK